MISYTVYPSEETDKKKESRLKIYGSLECPGIYGAGKENEPQGLVVKGRKSNKMILHILAHEILC